MLLRIKTLAFYFLGVFGILLLHQSIPHTDHYINISFHHHHGEQDDELEDDFQRVPLENHAETYPSEYLTTQKVRGSKGKIQSDQVLEFYPNVSSKDSQANKLKVYPRLVLFEYSDLCHCTYSLRGPPQFV